MIDKSGNTLPVVETFYTIQGEGHYSGTPAYFVRLAGCDVGCVWCDVKESWDANLHPDIDVEEIADSAQKSNTRVVVVTGGEPAMHNLEPLTQALKKRGLGTHIETSGVYELTGLWDWITFSPKKFKAPQTSLYEQAHELKIVVNHKSDLNWAVGHAESVSGNCKLYLQPVWEKHEEMSALILDFLRRNTGWRISLQIHKFLGVS